MPGAKGNDGCNNVTSTAAMRRRSLAAVARATRPGRHGRRAATPPAHPSTESGPADDLYFDSVSRIQVPTWSRGRIGLVGDAASCVSLFGDGSSLAMTGAFTLADSLNGDIPAGLRTYEARHRPERAAKENSVAYATRLSIPATSARIAVRNFAMYLMPLVNAAGRLGIPRGKWHSRPLLSEYSFAETR
jgi:2-polyprenyl-6-methoxyphenol hydroxylase-like FAD-dependent oxidoreductase